MSGEKGHIEMTTDTREQELTLVPHVPENTEERLPMHFPGLTLNDIVARTQSMRGRNRYIIRDTRGVAWIVTVEPARLMLQGE